MIGYSIQKYYRYDDDNHWEGKIYTSLESKTKSKKSKTNRKLKLRSRRR